MTNEPYDAGAEWMLSRASNHKAAGLDSVQVPCALTMRLMAELLEKRKQAALDAESRKASQEEFARLNAALNDARGTAQKLATMYDESCRSLGQERAKSEDAAHKIGVLLHEIADTAIACHLMREDAPPLDGPNAILFLQMMRESKGVV